MSIAFVTRDFTGTFPNIIPGGCAYYRCYLPMSVSGQHSRLGFPAWDPIRGYGIKENAQVGMFGFSTAVLKLIMDRTTPKQIELAQNLGQRIIIDIDDYYDGLTPANKAYALTDPAQNKRSNREFYKEAIARADLITVSTPFLLDWQKQQRDNVHLVRNGVNMYQFTPIQHRPGRPTLGWTGATSYRNNDLEQLREWLPDFLEEHDLMFHHAGHSPDAPSFAELTGVDPKRVRTSPLLPITHYASGFTFDIGIVPLKDIPFNQAKSNIKGLEYAAAGIPFIASDMSEYRTLHEDGVGRIASTPEQWKKSVEELLDYQARRLEAKRIRRTVSERWSIESRAKEWQAVFSA